MARKPRRTKDKGGRPPSLKPDEKTLKQVFQASQMQCTKVEAAALLGVCKQTFHTFLDSHKKAKEAWDQGRELGKVSLRRIQFDHAKKHWGMAKFLGEQILDQKDRKSTEISGPDGQPIATTNTDLSKEDLAAQYARERDEDHPGRK